MTRQPLDPKTDLYRAFGESFDDSDFDRLDRILKLWQANVQSARKLHNSRKGNKKSDVAKTASLNVGVKKLAGFFRTIEESVQS